MRIKEERKIAFDPLSCLLSPHLLVATTGFRLIDFVWYGRADPGVSEANALVSTALNWKILNHICHDRNLP